MIRLWAMIRLGGNDQTIGIRLGDNDQIMDNDQTREQ